MGILDGPAIDPFARPLAAFHPLKDLPIVTAWLDASTLTGANASAVAAWPDSAGMGATLAMGTAANQPTLTTAGQNGKNVVHFASGKYLANTQWGASWREPAWAQPNTMFIVAKIASANAGSSKRLLGSSSSGRQELHIGATNNDLVPYAGADGGHGGENICDDTWHVFVAEFGTAYCSVYVDGTLAGYAASQSQSSNSMVGLALAGDSAGANLASGIDVAEVIVCNSRVKPDVIDKCVAYLGRKWGLTVATSSKRTHYVDTTDSGSVAVRYWTPLNPAASIPWIIWLHPFTQNEQITAGGYFAYPLVLAALNEGWGFIATNAHGDNWGNDNSISDVLHAYNLANSIIPASAVILTGASMGGLAVETAANRATLGATLKGVVGIDAVTNLVWAYTGNSGAYTTSINTAYGIAAVGSIPAGNDPNQETLANTPRRYYASAVDTNVDKTNNTDAYRTKLAALGTPPAEFALVNHADGHLASGGVQARDYVAFVKRCLAR